VNIGHIGGGTSMNLIPARAAAGADIRIPFGVTAEAVEAAVAAALGGLDGVSWRVKRRVEPSATPVDAEILRCVASAAARVLGRAPALNMRVGASDARLFRAAGIPTVVYGPTPFNMGGADEYALMDELCAVATVHALAALEFLSAD
jgi:acetylornithine deacetylase/succinyl-diaminopimelate desuccinylase-like protein